MSDPVPFHTAHTTQEWLAKNFHNYVTLNLLPPSDLDSHHLDIISGVSPEGNTTSSFTLLKTKDLQIVLLVRKL